MADRLGASTDATTTAFETLRNPVARFVHEMLWLWPDDGGPTVDLHNRAVNAHVHAIEAVRADPASADGMLEALELWANSLADDASWRWAIERVRAVDDPRLTRGAVEVLRERIPEHLVATSVAFAATARDEVGDTAARTHIYAVALAPFDEAYLERATREVIRPTEDWIRDNCRMVLDDDNTVEGLANAAWLLDEADEQLPVVETLLHGNGELAHLLHEQVADAANQCAITYSNAHPGESIPQVLAILDDAVELVEHGQVRDQIASNIRILEEIEQVDPVPAVPPPVPARSQTGANVGAVTVIFFGGGIGAVAAAGVNDGPLPATLVGLGVFTVWLIVVIAMTARRRR